MIFKEIQDSDIKSARSYLNQLIDVIQEDVSSSISRKKYQHFVTGGLGPELVSSLFQTVYDQDFTLQTANPIFDITVGLNPNGSTVSSTKIGTDIYGKEVFSSNTIMMREKMDTYRQFAQVLLGDSSKEFNIIENSTQTIDSALFICFKRLFSRDSIKDGTVALRLFTSGSIDTFNLNVTSERGEHLITDYGQKREMDIAGSYSNLISSSTNTVVGRIFYERGIIIFDITRLFDNGQLLKGEIRSVKVETGKTTLGVNGGGNYGNPNAKFIPDLMVSGSVDDIIDHVCSTRFSSGSFSAMTFQNVTNINSTLIFCRADADMFNYSQNPTYTDDDNRIVVIPVGEENTQKSYTFITTVGLYDADQNLLAVSKLSRPIEKTPETEVNLRLRLDF